MTTDITELAQSLKTAAEKAGIEQWVNNHGEVNTADYEVDGGVYIDHICNCEIVGTESPRAEFIALANPDNILALVEALEKAQAKNALVAGGIEAATKLHERIAELESFRTAYMEWSDKTDWVNTDRRFGVVKPLGKHRADVLKTYIDHLESRAVKLPKRTVGEVMHMSGFSRDYAEGWCSGNDNAIHEMRAAGIKVEGE
ncbi:Uncharacterised protein [Raoultella terrigena]|uniref:Ead/Ea22-like family protein n=1 Tax=Raoultella terrigena TaxID=577 RepID=A0A7Z8Z9Q4_RAOTE|nr:Uncharacterised protein [Raoultella terrigena]